MIEVNNLSKSFDQTSVLKNIGLTVEKGEIFALLGSNGAGKTTFISILATLLKPDGGSIAINGFNGETEAAKVREVISLTGQFSAVDDILTGRENLECIARLRRVKNVKEAVDDMIRKVGLLDACDQAVATYSGGMRRRIDIGMGLIGAPPILFLDEPTTGLDPEARIAIYDIIKSLANQGTTILLTTQYLEEAEQLADRIAILHEGSIVVSGTFEQLKAQFPKPTIEYVEKQPTLEEIFLSIVRKRGNNL